MTRRGRRCHCPCPPRRSASKPPAYPPRGFRMGSPGVRGRFSFSHGRRQMAVARRAVPGDRRRATGGGDRSGDRSGDRWRVRGRRGLYQVPCHGQRQMPWPVPNAVAGAKGRGRCQGPWPVPLFCLLLRCSGVRAPVPRPSDEPDGFVRSEPRQQARPRGANAGHQGGKNNSNGAGENAEGHGGRKGRGPGSKPSGARFGEKERRGAEMTSYAARGKRGGHLSAGRAGFRRRRG